MRPSAPTEHDPDQTLLPGRWTRANRRSASRRNWLAGSESLLTRIVQMRLRAKTFGSEIRKPGGEERVLNSSECQRLVANFHSVNGDRLCFASEDAFIIP